MTHPRGVTWAFKMRAKRLVLGRARFDRAPWKKIRRHLGNDWTVIEAGAYDGRDTRLLSELVPRGHVHAFEPNPDAFVRLNSVSEDASNVSATLGALGKRSGEGTLHVAQTGDGGLAPSSSLLEPTAHLTQFPHVSFAPPVTTQVVNLDDFIRSHPTGPSIFLWLDLQGLELDVVRSSPKTLARTRMIYTEVSVHPLFHGAASWTELDSFLRGLSFRAVAERVGRVSGNVLYVR